MVSISLDVEVVICEEQAGGGGVLQGHGGLASMVTHTVGP
jgi:hypothetical protein